MRKRYANRRGNNYKQIKVNEDYFKGYACYVSFNNIETPKVVYNGISNMCIIDNDYEWIMLYPEGFTYSITIIYDNNSSLVEWYFDCASSVGLENNIPYQDDLYLDMVILPTKEVIILDEDELLNAYKNNEITKDMVEHAYKTLEHLKEKYANNIEELITFTDHIYDIIKIGDANGS